MNFSEKLEQRWQAVNSLLCVGLDPDPARLPEAVLREKDPIFAFNRAVVDATADLACAYKPQFAYYAAADALESLKRTIDYIREEHPAVPVILDSKRGDIGSTAAMYAREAFDVYGADAVTVNPYMGGDTLEPFLQRKEKGVIILCRTSNPGSGDFQSLRMGESGRQLFEIVAEKAAREWNANGNVALVVGATYPGDLESVRGIVGDMPILAPGIGAQGGDVEAVLKAGASSNGTGLIINSSRGILYASTGPDFAEAARKAAQQTRDLINSYR